MKQYLSAFVLAATVFSTVHAVFDPCAEAEDLGCVPENKACTHAPDDCCDGFDCFGYPFFKRCQEPPLCLSEWYACNPDPTAGDRMECCAGMACVASNQGVYECQKADITKRTVDLPGFNVEDYVEEPIVPPINDKVSECENKKPIKACLTGDPHITSFDKLTYDCQGVGEHQIYQAPGTRRQVQGRFTRVGDRSVSVTHGVVVQDEGGKEIPKVQVSIPAEEDTVGTDIAVTRDGKQYKCTLQLFVDNVLQEPKQGFENDHVRVAFGSQTVIEYKASGMKVTVQVGYWNGCLLNTCLYTDICEGDEAKVQGLLGTPDGNTKNDWMKRDGSFATIPSSVMDRKRKPAYDWSTEWCLRNKDESLFHHNEPGYDFGYYSRCDLDYGQSLVEFMDDVPQNIIDACDEELGCMMDALEGGLDAAIQERSAKLRLTDQCSPDGGSCSNGFECCDGLNCLDLGPEKQCSTKTTVAAIGCLEERGDCSQAGATCCDGMTCVTKKNGKKKCEVQGSCAKENKSCSNGKACCNGLKCVGHKSKFKTCKKLGACSQKGQFCNDEQGCCDGNVCEKGVCKVDKPEGWGTTCWRNGWDEEKECEGDLVCLPYQRRKVCADPGGKRAAKYQWGCCDAKFPCDENLVCAEPTEKVLKKALKSGLAPIDGIRQCIPDGQREFRQDFRAMGNNGGGWCKKGVFSTKDKTCCAKSCGLCGGRGCSRRHGGASNCCPEHITRECTDGDDTGCRPPADVAQPKTTGADVDNESNEDNTGTGDLNWCAEGFLNDGKCCAASCGRCGTWNCHKLPGGASKCCPQKISRTCKNKHDTACEVPAKELEAGNDDDSDDDSTDDDLEWCAEGFLSGKKCCAKSCGRCGGKQCSTLPGGNKKCCPGQFKTTCATKKDTACVVP